MADSSGNLRKYMIVGAIGAVGGGLLVAMVTRAMPKMMSGMMQKMMSMMGGEGCSPAEMCQKMMGASEKPESQED